MVSEAPATDEDLALGELAAAQPAGLLPPGASSAAVVARMLRILRANAFSFSDGCGGSALGYACYPAAATLNHSCHPNCVLTYGDNGSIIVRTARPIKAGTELTHAYVNLCAPTRMRRAELESKYAFTCECTRCVDGAKVTDHLHASPALCEHHCSPLNPLLLPTTPHSPPPTPVCLRRGGCRHSDGSATVSARSLWWGWGWRRRWWRRRRWRWWSGWRWRGWSCGSSGRSN